jgi:hypothetical protein
MDKIHLDCHLYILIPLVQETNSIRSIVSIIALLKIKSKEKFWICHARTPCTQIL